MRHVFCLRTNLHKSVLYYWAKVSRYPNKKSIKFRKNINTSCIPTGFCENNTWVHILTSNCIYQRQESNSRLCSRFNSDLQRIKLPNNTMSLGLLTDLKKQGTLPEKTRDTPQFSGKNKGHSPEKTRDTPQFSEGSASSYRKKNFDP